MEDENVFTVQAGIAEVQTRDAYLNSYKAYRASQDVSNIAMNPLSRPTRGAPITITEEPSAANYPYPEGATTLTSESSFVSYRPSSYRILTIVSAIICCCPVGIAALIYSFRADSAKKAGYFSKAAILGKSAKDLAIVSIVLGVFIVAVCFLIVLLLFIPGVADFDD